MKVERQWKHSSTWIRMNRTAPLLDIVTAAFHAVHAISNDAFLFTIPRMEPIKSWMSFEHKAERQQVFYKSPLGMQE
eukprot:15342193-Ditylum_brightwellii.AAC.1